ncbi:MAG: phosphotransferase [Myxococcota bacterium]
MGEDLTALAKRIEAHVGAATGAPAAVSTIARLPGGACQELFRVDLATAGFEGRVVLRSDAPRSLPGSIDRRQEFRVIEAALAAGVRTPRVQWLTEGLVRDGAHAYFMDWADGEAIGRRVVRNAELEAARARLPVELGAELARIHSITPARAPASAFRGWKVISISGQTSPQPTSPPTPRRAPAGGSSPRRRQWSIRRCRRAEAR